MVRRFFIIAALMLTLSGCVTIERSVDPDPVRDEAPRVDTGIDNRTEGQDPYALIGLGMQRAEVAALLKGEVTIGYEKDAVTGEFKPVSVPTLYSAEVLAVNGIDYQVDLYIIKDQVTSSPADSDLMPFIYQGGVLIGKGRKELDSLRSRKQ